MPLCGKSSDYFGTQVCRKCAETEVYYLHTTNVTQKNSVKVSTHQRPQQTPYWLCGESTVLKSNSISSGISLLVSTRR